MTEYQLNVLWILTAMFAFGVLAMIAQGLVKLVLWIIDYIDRDLSAGEKMDSLIRFQRKRRARK